MRVENPQARDYYVGETGRQGWSSRTLARAIETHTYQRLLKAPETPVVSAARANPLHLLKDPYILEFLDLSERPEPGERQLFASKYRLVLPSEEELQAELERRHILDWPRPEGDTS
jgi:hypothetical protein